MLTFYGRSGHDDKVVVVVVVVFCLLQKKLNEVSFIYLPRKSVLKFDVLWGFAVVVAKSSRQLC